MSADQILFRFHRHGDRWAALTRIHGKPGWDIAHDSGRVNRMPVDHEFDQNWTEPVHLGELIAMHDGERSQVRRLAEKYLRYSLGNEGLHRDLQRAVFSDILYALGDYPGGIHDRLAEARVMDVTPIESALDGADILVASLQRFAEHQGLDSDEQVLLELADAALIRLHDRLQTRAAEADERRGRARASTAREALDQKAERARVRNLAAREDEVRRSIMEGGQI